MGTSHGVPLMRCPVCEEKSKRAKRVFIAILLTPIWLPALLVIFVFLMSFVVAHQKAKHFNEMTGANVTMWDVYWVPTIVANPAKTTSSHD